MPGRWIEFGSSEPTGTISSAYMQVQSAININRFIQSLETNLDDRKRGIPPSNTVVVVLSVPEIHVRSQINLGKKKFRSRRNGPKDSVPRFVRFPCSYKCNVSRECRLHHIPLPVELSNFFGVAWFQNAIFSPTVIIPDRNGALLDSSR
jgi:hypothetical protein